MRGLNQKNTQDLTSKFITITVEEYIQLNKKAAMLEMIVNDQSYGRETVNAVKTIMEEAQEIFVGMYP